MLNNALFSSKSNSWETPQDLFDQLNREFSFTLDAAASPENAKCPKYYTEEDNGLIKGWMPYTTFVNPPYGREVGQWAEKAYWESRLGATVVMLLPARVDTRWFHDWILGKAEIRFIKGRLKFGGSKNSAPFPSMLVIYRGFTGVEMNKG